MSLKIIFRFIIIILLFHQTFPQNKLQIPSFGNDQIPAVNLYRIASNNRFSNTGFHIQSIIRSNWQNGKWNKSVQVVYDYKNNNSILSEATKTWNGLKWNDSLRILYSYDSLNREIEVLHQNKNNNDWVNMTRERSEVWSTENKLMYHEEFNNGVWIISWAETVSQSVSGKFRTVLLPSAGGYYSIGRSYEYYNEFGNVTESAFYWINTTNDILDGKDIFYYDSLNRLTKKVSFTNSFLGLEESRREIYEYNDVMKTSLKTLYQMKDSVWQPTDFYLSEYDENNNEIKVTKQVFKDSIWIKESLEEKSYAKMLKKEEVSSLADKYILFQNYPNPFNPSTVIKFSLPEKSKVKLSVYDLMGREVDTFVDVVLSSGEHEARFNAAKYSSGIYFYKLSTPSTTITKKMILVK